MRSVRIALFAGLTALGATLIIVLGRPPLTVAGTDGVQAKLNIASTPGNQKECQAAGTLPQGTQAVRLSLSANEGPKVGVEVLSGSTVLISGERAAGWGVDETVTVPVTRVPRTISNARICVTIGPAPERVQVNGAEVRTSVGEDIWLRMEYLRPSHGSWFSLASSVIRDIGIGRAPSGDWAAYLAIALTVALCALSSRLVLRELR
ncbi:MAG: hypothetical protein ABSB69_04290 [Solirubrobacteraceae bacterium]|jgi:hypothetical protein